MTSHAEFADILAERRAAAEARVRAHDEHLRGIREARIDGNDDDEHDPEGSTLSTEWSQFAGLRDADERELREISAAFERIEAGTYGICASCGRRIPVGRLRARPMATLCVECAEKAA